ncbi:DUF1761 domain-containing protein [Brevundimonas sp. 2R-24]|uniref:DUF1761 domain-containing protein n=1 Tax=Peiella sedimenti TaxID=3061083 RepID=A0ABT8SPI0_9CAUL|nr:DUF1761 domain-containing protein [Caulobacteraceae bacterium XZ-24]
MKGVNWTAVVIAAIVMYLIGWLWYGMLFEAQWMALSGVTAEQMAQGGTTAMILGAVNSLVTAVGLGWAVPRLGGGGWVGGARTGFLIGLFFACTSLAYAFIYGGAPTGLIPIDGGHFLVIYTVGGAVIGGLKLGRSA